MIDTLLVLFVPMLCSYFALSDDLFFSVAARNATGLEAAGNVCLTPLQYLVAGKEAVQTADGSWQFTQKFDYNHDLWPRAIASVTALPASFILGSALKGLGYCLSQESKERYAAMRASRQSTAVHSNLAAYRLLGIDVGDLQKAERFTAEGVQRRPGDENHLQAEKEALKDVGHLLTEAGIPWWIDCGSLLGAYRYGGVIPWDDDIDMAILRPDFENARRALNQLDPRKYIVQDWSGRDFPCSFFKIFVRDAGYFLDLFTYEIDPEKQEIHSIFSMGKNVFCFQWWKERERQFSTPISWNQVFPLKRATFDTVEVFVPQNPKVFLQRYYGENLSPAKVYDPQTGRFEKDLSHPYWQRAHVH